MAALDAAPPTQHIQQGLGGEKAVESHGSIAGLAPGSLLCAQGEGSYLPPSWSVWSLVHVGAMVWGKGVSEQDLSPLQVPWGLSCPI